MFAGDGGGTHDSVDMGYDCGSVSYCQRAGTVTNDKPTSRNLNRTVGG